MDGWVDCLWTWTDVWTNGWTGGWMDWMGWDGMDGSLITNTSLYYSRPVADSFWSLLTEWNAVFCVCHPDEQQPLMNGNDRHYRPPWLQHPNKQSNAESAESLHSSRKSTYVLLSVVSKRIKYLTQQCFKLSEVNCFSLTACWLLFQMASMFWCSWDWSSLAAAMGSDHGENLSLIQLRPKWPVLCCLCDLRERLWQQELVFLICTRFSTLNKSPLIVKNLCQQTNAQQNT